MSDETLFKQKDRIMQGICKFVPAGQPISDTALSQLMPFLLNQQAEIDRLREALYRAIKELAYVASCTEACGSSMCASSEGKSIIDEGIQMLGVRDLGADVFAEAALAPRKANQDKA